jgi:hypothetical protein
MATKLASQSLKIAQGEDKSIAITVLNDAAAAVDMSATGHDQVVISLSVNDVIQKTYRRDTPGAGEGSIAVSGGSNNIVTVVLARADSDTFPVGILKAHIVGKAVTSGYHTEYEITLGSVVKGFLKDAVTTG